MTRKGHTEEQIIAAMQQAEAGATRVSYAASSPLARRRSTTGRSKYVGLGVQELRELRELR